MKAVKAQVDANKELQGMKGEALSTAIYQRNMQMYADLAKQANEQLQKFDKSWDWGGRREMLTAERDRYVKMSEDLKSEYEGRELLKNVLPDLFNPAVNEPEQAPVTQTPVQ